MTPDLRIILWRHGRTQWNTEHRFQGHTDVGLDEVGREQITRAAIALSKQDPTAIISSDLTRARDTAEALADLVGLTVDVDRRLRETEGGAWEGRRRTELLETDPESYRAWLDGEHIRPGGTGELRADVGVRVHAAIHDRLQTLSAGATLVVVTHGGSARAAMAPLLGQPFESVRHLTVMENAAWSVLERISIAGEPRWMLRQYNVGA